MLSNELQEEEITIPSFPDISLYTLANFLMLYWFASYSFEGMEVTNSVSVHLHLHFPSSLCCLCMSAIPALLVLFFILTFILSFRLFINFVFSLKEYLELSYLLFPHSATDGKKQKDMGIKFGLEI